MNNPRLHRLTVNFAILAFMAAFLLGLGPRSAKLTYLIGAGVVCSYVLTDRLQLLVLPKLAAYFSMLAGAIAAIGEFFVYRNVDHLTAVASLLIYVQFGLMFQKKDRQVFEQWAAFILLELIVASLINDNVLYGIMLVPILFVGCSTMLAYSSYVSHLRSGQSGLDSNSIVTRALKWMGRDAELKTARGSIKMTAEKAVNQAGNSQQMVGFQRTFALVFNVIVFAISFFYIMPRLQSGAYEGSGFAHPVVGFSGEVTLSQVGELLENDSAALKVRFKSLPGDKDMRPIEPPYIRGAVCHIYSGEGRWQNSNRGTVASYVTNSLATTSINPELTNSTDGVEILVEEQTHFEDATFSLPPFARNSTVGGPTEVISTDWVILDKDRNKTARRNKQEYRFRTYAFTSGFQSRLLPEFEDCQNPGLVNAEYVEQKRIEYLGSMLAFNDAKLQGVTALRDKIIASEKSKEVGPLVLAFEDYLVTSPEFKYSLAPPPRNDGVDPIEDFVSNHKSGHCQYFASTLAMMLRSMSIPSRIILGFRPADFNESGMFFVVRQRHAHAWVEAYLTREQLESTGLEIPNYVTHGAWLRLDPTPEGEGSNAGGSLRSRTGNLETLQQLWQDYVMNVDSSDRSSILNLFDAKEQGPFASLKLTLARTLASLQANRLMAGVLSPTQWFSFQGALIVMILIVSFVMLLQFGSYALKRLGATKWQRSLSTQRLTGLKFYRRVLQALNKLHLKRSPSQTPLEFAKQVEEHFKSRAEQFGDAVPKVQFLTSLYYRLRFGFDVTLQESEWQEIEAATQSIERLAANRSRVIKGLS